MTSDRTIAALAAARGPVELSSRLQGRPEGGRQARRQGQPRARRGLRGKAGPDAMREMQSRSLSLRQMAAELTAQGIQTPRGGQWTAAAVRVVLMRAG